MRQRLFRSHYLLCCFILFPFLASTQSYNYSPIYSNEGKVGIYDSISGKVILPAEYKEIQYRGDRNLGQWRKANYKGFHNFFWIKNTAGKWALFSFRGKKITEFAYDMGYNLYSNFMPVKKGDWWGGIDSTGREIIPFSYTWLKDITGTCIPAQKDSLWGALDVTGRIVLPFIYSNIYDGQIWLITRNKKTFYFNPVKRTISGESYDAIFLGGSSGYFTLQQGSKFGYLSEDGKTNIKPQFDSCGYFENGYAMVKLNGKWGFINKKGQLKIKYAYDQVKSFEDGLAGVALKGKWGFIDTTGRIVVPCQFTGVYWFREGIAIVKKTGKTGFEKEPVLVNPDYYEPPSAKEVHYLINKKGQLISKAYDEIDDDMTNALRFRVKINDKYGYLDNRGRQVISCMYDDAGQFFEGKARVSKNGESFYINSKNERIESDR